MRSATCWFDGFVPHSKAYHTIKPASRAPRSKGLPEHVLTFPCGISYSQGDPRLGHRRWLITLAPSSSKSRHDQPLPEKKERKHTVTENDGDSIKFNEEMKTLPCSNKQNLLHIKAAGVSDSFVCSCFKVLKHG